MRKDWEVKTWNEVLSITNGKNQKNVEDSNGIYPIYGSGGIMGYANDFLCPNNTVIIGRKGNINKPIFVEEKFWNVDTAFGLVPKEGILVAKYLFYYCVNYDFEKLNKAVTIPSLTKSDLLNIKIALPPLETQQQIVEELDCLSSIMEKQKKQLEELDNLAQSIFYDMFGDPIKNEKGWETQLIGDVCKFSQGIQVDLTLQSLEPKENWNRFLRISDYTIGDIEKRYVDIQELKYYVYPDDVVIVRYGASAGFVGINKEGILANNLFKLNHNKSILDYKFLYYFLSTDYYKCFIQKVAFGAAMPALSFNSFKSFKVFIPPLPLQQDFASKIEAIEKQKELIKKSIKETEDLFNSRMDYYFN